MIVLAWLVGVCFLVWFIKGATQKEKDCLTVSAASPKPEVGDDATKDIATEGLGVSAPRPIGTRTSPVAPVGKWTPAERELWIGVLEELERQQ